MFKSQKLSNVVRSSGDIQDSVLVEGVKGGVLSGAVVIIGRTIKLMLDLYDLKSKVIFDYFFLDMNTIAKPIPKATNDHR